MTIFFLLNQILSVIFVSVSSSNVLLQQLFNLIIVDAIISFIFN